MRCGVKNRYFSCSEMAWESIYARVLKNVFMICTSHKKGTVIDKIMHYLESGKCES